MNEPPDDADLRGLLRQSWNVKPRANPNFRARVWARIEARAVLPQTWAAWFRTHVLGVSLASVASLVVAVGGAGLAARLQDQRDHERLAARYVASIDPHAQVGLAHPGR